MTTLLFRINGGNRMAYTKEQREAKKLEQEEKLRKELEEKIRKEYEKKLKAEVSNIKSNENKVDTKSEKAKKIQNSTKIPLDTIIPVTSNFEGLLYFESKKTMGYSVEWDAYGSTEYIELSELVGMRNSYRRFFEDNWIIVEDTDDYSAGEIYSFLKVEKYYRNVLTPDNIDELFKKEPKEVIKIVSTLSNGMKDIIKTKAKVMYDDKKLDSNKMIEALEAALNIKFSI